MVENLNDLLDRLDRLDDEFVGVRKNETRVAQFDEIMEDVMVLFRRGVITGCEVHNDNDSPTARVLLIFRSPQVFSEFDDGATLMADAFSRADMFSFYVREEDGMFGSTLAVKNYWLAE